MTEFKLSENFIDKYRTKKAPFGFNGLGELVYLRTYSRIKPDGSNEKWFETVERVVNGTFSMQKEWIENHDLGWSNQKAQKSAQEMYDRMFNMKFLPPGRGLWAMGSSLTKEKKMFAALNNCAFVSTEHMKDDPSKPFTFLMDASMIGVGVGFDTKGAGSITIKGFNKSRKSEKYIIEDSREGWVESLKLLLDSYFFGTSQVEFDYSKIREAGLPIKGFGGVSSGPLPLIELHQNISKVLDKEIGSAISVRTIVDIQNLIGTCVVAGNVRRTSEIAFGSHSDEEFLDLKNYDKNPDRAAYGWTSNNTIFCDIGMNYKSSAERTKKHAEPGYAWLENMQNFSQMNGSPDFKDHRVKGGNPSLRKGTKVMTTEGIFEIQDLQDRPFKTYNLDGKISDAKCFLSGKDKELYKITLVGGVSYYATPEHEWPILKDGQYVKVKTQDLKENSYLPIIRHNTLNYGDIGSYDEGFLMGWVYGDGWYIKRSDTGRNQLGICVGFKDDKSNISVKLINTLRTIDPNFTGEFSRRGDKGTLEINISNDTIINHLLSLGLTKKEEGIPKILWKESSEEFRKGFIDGIFSSDGSIDKSNGTISLSSSRSKLLSDISELLGFYGIKNNTTTRTGKSTFPNGKDYDRLYTQHTMRINQAKSIDHFKNVFKLTNLDKNEKLKSKDIERPYRNEDSIRIVSIEKTDLKEDVWDITVYDDTHCFQLSHCITGNCLEQSLEHMELCCLVETFPNNHESVEDYKKTLKYAYLYAKTVTLGKTHWAETNRVLLRNRRIGCSMSGIAQFITYKGLDTLKHWCEEGVKHIENLDKHYSDWLAIPLSIKKISVKPSGSVSLLAGATPGIHYPESRFYIRRMRLGVHSELVKPLRSAGYKLEPSVTDPVNTLVVEIPIDVGAGIRTIRDVSIWEQVALAAFMQRYWADNQVSCTVTFDPKTEGDQIEHILNFYQYQLKGISFLPKTEKGSFPQMPYEEITEDLYKELIKDIKLVDFSNVKDEQADIDVFCDGEKCIIDAARQSKK